MTRKLTFLILALFALISGPGWGQNYQLVTSTSDLVAGCNYVIGNGNSGSVKFMSTEANNNNRKATADITVSTDGEVTIDSTVLKLELGGTTGAWTLKTTNYLGTNGYLASAASGSNNYCRVIADKTTATISFSDNAAVITIQPHTSRNILRYNSSASCFACYSSGQNAVYLYKESTSSKTLTSLAISGTPTKTTYNAGEEFDPAGLVVTGTYDDASTETITSGITWDVTPSPLTAGTTSVNITATVGNITSPAYTVNGLTVTEHVQTYANTYTSNVELTTTGGTSASTAKVIWENVEYNALKCGTSSVAGACVVTIPANTQTLHFHAAGWNGETVKLNGTFNLVADGGVSGNSPFTLQNDPETSDYFTLDPQGATSITFTATSGKRFVLFGVNAEITQAPVATPTFNPTSGSYNINQTVEITCDDEATIYYTTDGNIPTTSSDQYTQAITLTIPGTITIKAIAVNANGSSHVGSATYVITRTQYTPAQLLEEIPTPDDENHTVVFENNIITKLVNNGFYLSINTENDFYVYCTNRPSEWEVGGKVSGTIVGKWTTYNSNNEFCPSNYDNFQYTAPAKYTISFSTNGVAETATIVINQGAEIGSTLPEPTATNVPNGYTFRGWNANEVALTNDEPTYITAETIPTGDMTLYAVFAIAETVEEVGQKTFVLTEDDFNGTSYDANNGSHTKDGITYTSNQVMKQSDVIQFQSGKGYIYNVTAMKVTSISITKTAGTFTVYEGSEEHPTETITNNESGGYTFKNESDRYFSICVGSATGKVSNITVTYEGVTSSTTYSNFCTSVTALSGNLAEAITEANTAYYISGAATVEGEVTINGVLGNADASLLVINDGGQLIHNNAGVAATFQKNITAYADAEGNDGYYLIANPTDNETVVNLVNAEGYDLYTFDGAADLEWINMKSSPVVANDGIGYLYANSANVTLGFAGEIIPAGSTDINLNYANKEFGGFNLIGNPFACNAYVGKSFYVIDGSELVLSENNYVAPCEGFFVEATEADQSVTISTTDPEAPSALSLTVSQNRGKAIDRAIVNFDSRSNLHKFMMNPNHTNISLAKNGEEFAAISTAAEGEMPVNFKAEKNGTYTITVSTENVEANYLHLIDNLTGADIDLLTTDSYTFDATTRDYASRFKLVFGVNNSNAEVNGNSFAYISNGELIISNEGRATLQVIDMTGRIVSSQEIEGEGHISTEGMTAGVYVLNLNGTTQKIVVR